MFTNWFRKKKHAQSNEKQIDLLILRINQALSNCNNDKINYLKQINKLKQIGIQAIKKSVEIPKTYKYREIEYFEKQVAENYSEQAIAKVNNFTNIREILEQITILQSKLAAIQLVIQKFQKLKIGYMQTKSRLLNTTDKNKATEIIHNHLSKNSEIKNTSLVTNELSEQNTELMDIEADIVALEENFRLQEQLYLQLNNLDENYIASDTLNSEKILSELEKLKQHIQK